MYPEIDIEAAGIIKDLDAQIEKLESMLEAIMIVMERPEDDFNDYRRSYNNHWYFVSPYVRHDVIGEIDDWWNNRKAEIADLERRNLLAVNARIAAVKAKLTAEELELLGIH